MTKAEQALIYEMDCARFAREKLHLDTSDQRVRKFLNSSSPQIILLWSRQTGKTHSAAAKVTQKAIFDPDSISLIVSATQRQAGILQNRVTRFMNDLRREGKWKVTGKEAVLYEDPLDANSRMVRCSVLSMALENGSEIISVPASPETVRGYAPNLIVMDEAGLIPDEVYYAVRPMRTRTKAQICVMSSAWAQTGFFYDIWENHRSSWEASEIKAEECSWISKKELRDEKDSMPLSRYQREYENVFMPMQGAILPQQTIEAAYDEEADIIVPGFVKKGSGFAYDDDAEIIEVKRR